MSRSMSGPPPLKRMIVPAIFVGALFLVVFLRQPNGPESTPDQWVLTGETMGTAFTVKVVVPPDPQFGPQDVEGMVRRTVDGVDFAMSTYRPDSELCRFNDHDTTPFEVSAPLLGVVTEAQRVAVLSKGAFDITVGPLVDAWGFGPEPVIEPPSEADLDRLLARNGFEFLEVDTSAATLRKVMADLRCDLSAIAKGFAVDRVSDGLTVLGLTDFMVEIGGEVRVSGYNERGERWRIGVERPQAGRRGVWSSVALENAAMATSGDYRNYYERDGVRISHTIDPRTGRPITHSLASVTVIHPSCMTADALATALNVLGTDEGRELVEREDLAALFLVRTDDGVFDEWTSDAWPGENSAGAGNVARDEDR